MVSVKKAIESRASDISRVELTTGANAVLDVMKLMINQKTSCADAFRRVVSAIEEIGGEIQSEAEWKNEVLPDPVDLGDVPGLTLSILGETCDDDDIQVVVNENDEPQYAYVYFSDVAKKHNIPLSAFNSWSRLGGEKMLTTHVVLFYDDPPDGIIATPIDGEIYGSKVYGFRWGDGVDEAYLLLNDGAYEVGPDIDMGIVETLGLVE